MEGGGRDREEDPRWKREHTRGRLECANGGVLNLHTAVFQHAHTTHHTAQTTCRRCGFRQGATLLWPWILAGLFRTSEDWFGKR